MKKYLALFHLSFIHTLKNYKALAGLSIFLITCLIIFANLWKITAVKTGLVDLNPAQLLWYIAFNQWILVSVPDTAEEIERDLRSGRLAYQLPRPLSYLGATFAEAAGTLVVNLTVLGAVSLAFTWWQTGVLPFHPMGLPISILFGVLAGAVATIFQIFIGLSAFWLQEVSPFVWIWEKLLFMFGGLLLPLAVYPQWMQTLAYMTPFPSILGGRSALVFDLSLHQVTMLATSLVSWGLFGLIGLLCLYRKGLKILNAEGG